MRLVKHFLAGVATCMVIATDAPPAMAQAWPDKPVRWIVGYPPGGGADILARLIGAHVAHSIGQPVVVENRPGASASLGADAAAKAAPDGYTFLVADVGMLVHNIALFRKLPYDPVKNFVSVALFTQTPLMLIAGPNEEARTVQEYVARAKAQPGKFSIASPGAGAHHFGLELFKLKAGIDVVTIPYKGAGPAVLDVVGGQVPVLMTDPSSAAAMLRAGKLRALAVASRARLPEFPAVPTLSESVLPNFEAYVWAGLVAPTGTPAAVVTRINAEVQKALHSPDLVKRFSDLGLSTKAGPPEEMTELWKADLAVWPDVIRRLGVVYTGAAAPYRNCAPAMSSLLSCCVTVLRLAQLAVGPPHITAVSTAECSKPRVWPISCRTRPLMSFMNRPPPAGNNCSALPSAALASWKPTLVLNSRSPDPVPPLGGGEKPTAALEKAAPPPNANAPTRIAGLAAVGSLIALSDASTPTNWNCTSATADQLSNAPWIVL